MKYIIEASNVKKYFGNHNSLTKALNGVSFNVLQGDFIGIMGPSGSGKTTLLNTLSTLDKATSGSIMIDGKNIQDLNSKQKSDFRKTKVGFVFQDFNLINKLTVFENIALVLSLNGYTEQNIKKRVTELLSLIGLEGYSNRYPEQLSGGQKQLVATARAIAHNPRILFADEPTGSLDSKSSQTLLNSFSSLNEELQTTLLMVTHNPYAASYCKRVIFIKDGKIFNDLRRGDAKRKSFYKNIVNIVSVIEGFSGYDI